MRFNAKITVLEFALSHSPDSKGSLGTKIRSSENAAINRAENSIPAIAAAFGVFNLDRINLSFCIA
jgi:hypothetical protein